MASKLGEVEGPRAAVIVTRLAGPGGVPCLELSPAAGDRVVLTIEGAAALLPLIQAWLADYPPG